AYFQELERVLHWLTGSPLALGEPSVSNTDSLPSIRFVISLRDEYLAQLIPAAFLSGVERTVFHLQLLDTKNAQLAIKSPAQLFGYRYAEDCYRQLIQELTKEEQFVEPAHIQIVCEKLWNARGRELAQQNAA